MKKMKNFDKAMLVLIMLCLIVGSFFVLVMLFDTMILSTVASMVYSVFENANIGIKLLIALIPLIVIFLCVRILFVRQRKSGESTTSEHKGVLVRSGEVGSTYMTIDAIQYLVDQKVRSDDAIRDLENYIEVTPDEMLNIHLKVSIMADRVIPEVTEALQKELKDYMQSITGIGIQNVEILVAAPGVTTEAKSKQHLHGTSKVQLKK